MSGPGKGGRLPFLQFQRSKSGTVFWYVRRQRGRRIRILGDFGTDEFMAGYAAAVGQPVEPLKRRASTRSVGHLILSYRQSHDFTSLSEATRYQREFHLRRIDEAIGSEDYSSIKTCEIQRNFESRKAKPSQARHWLDTLKSLFRFAKRQGWLQSDPTEGVDSRIRRARKALGYEPWTETDIRKFESKWARGTRERLMFDILLYIGLRRGDACRLGPGNIQGSAITVITEKTSTEVTIAIQEPLKATLEAGPVGTNTFIASAKGQPLTKESFANAFRDAARAAGIPKPMHGMRKASANRAAEAGATASELQAMFGWTDHKMAAHYTKSAARKQLGMSGSAKLANAIGSY